MILIQIQDINTTIKKHSMFNQQQQSTQPKTAEQNNKNNILSPRSFFKLITDSIEQFRKHNLSVPTPHNYDQFRSTFDSYLSSFSNEYNTYLKNKQKVENCNNKDEQIQNQQKINKIPLKYFNDSNNFTLENIKKKQIYKKQEELSLYLDEIQIVLFTKSGKYPQKTNIILENINQLNANVDQSLSKVTVFRKTLHQKIVLYYSKQMKVSLLNVKIQRIKTTLQYAKAAKKISDLKQLSNIEFNQQTLANDQMLVKIKKNELQICNKLIFLKPILKNIEKYRDAAKNKLYLQFVKQLQFIITKLLSYNKQEWKNINNQQIQQNYPSKNSNHSYNNLTILNQTYFVFDSNSIDIVKNNLDKTKKRTTNADNQSQNTLNLSKIYNLWIFIQKFDLYDETEINEHFIKILVKHNDSFKEDMQSYISNFQINLKKEKPPSNILKGEIQTYAEFKNKIQTNNPIESKSPKIKQDKLFVIDMKFYLKITKFYFQMMKKIINFLQNNRQLQFIDKFRDKFYNFLKERITEFISHRKINHEVTIDDFSSYLQIICYWQNQQYDQIYDFCDSLKKKTIQQYLDKIQTNLLVKQIKLTIDQSTYLPISLSSENYMIFYYLLQSKTMTQDETNMSLTVTYQDNKTPLDILNQQFQPLRLINKNIIYKGKSYKICDSFLNLIKNIQRYCRLKYILQDFTLNIEEKICEIIGFYSWYNQKNLNNNKNGAKTLKNYCTFYSTLLFLKQILASLKITSKKIEKTKVQLNQCQTQIVKAITLTPFMMIQQKISLILQSKISTKPQIPINQSQKIIQILKISTQCLKEYFPLEHQQKLSECHIVKLLQATIKLIYKNYFGYLANMEKRGIAQITWFLPKFKQILQVTLFGNKNIFNKRGQLIDANSTFYLFNQQISEMQKLLRVKSKLL